MAARAGKRVLVVDDDPDIREALAGILVDEGYQVTACADGAQALAHLGAGSDPPCLILLDLMMPGMNGWELHARLRRDPALAGIPVVVISAGHNLQAAAESLDVAGFLAKPLQLDQLLTTVAQVCG